MTDYYCLKHLYLVATEMLIVFLRAWTYVNEERNRVFGPVLLQHYLNVDDVPFPHYYGDTFSFRVVRFLSCAEGPELFFPHVVLPFQTAGSVQPCLLEAEDV